MAIPGWQDEETFCFTGYANSNSKKCSELDFVTPIHAQCAAVGVVVGS